MSRRTTLIGALVVSVALNLLIAGVLIGRFSSRHPPTPPPGAWAAGELSAETRSRVREHMARQMESVRPMRRELRDAQDGIRAAVLAEPYDPEALKAALARLRSVTSRYQQLLHEGLAEIAAELPVEERGALVRTALERAHGGGRPPGPGRPGDRRDGPPRPPAPGQR